MGSFKVGDRVINNGRSGVVINIKASKGYSVYGIINNNIILYDVSIDGNSSHYFSNELELDVAWYREQKLKKLIGEV